MKKKPVGWLTIDRCAVQVKFHNAEVTRDFLKDQTTHGAESAETAARNYITSYLGQDDWTLRQQGFLGFQIWVPVDKDVVPDGPPMEWGDLKAACVAEVLRTLRPKWSCSAEWFNGVLNVDSDKLFMHFGCSNETLMADVYLSEKDMEDGAMLAESIDTGLSHNHSVEVLAGAIVGAVETFEALVLPWLIDLKKKEVADEPKV